MVLQRSGKLRKGEARPGDMLVLHNEEGQWAVLAEPVQQAVANLSRAGELRGLEVEEVLEHGAADCCSPRCRGRQCPTVFCTAQPLLPQVEQRRRRKVPAGALGKDPHGRRVSPTARRPRKGGPYTSSPRGAWV
eukprot:TRINITY_DN23405_c0_g2_i1.p4 TRINITY_DN23405_c0_g2~~TRINITY_DN23405_c0_g2_i1.p4  ORF type:complete len:134 (+),score=14.19 TRINITY_DN23405_c0_g2_i1:233-634(+)